MRDKARNQLRVQAALEIADQIGIPHWIETDIKAARSTFKMLPERSDLPAEINESLVVALYSK